MNIPIRNRAAKSDQIRSELESRQSQSFTFLVRTKQVSTQALLTWLPHPGTAIYLDVRFQ